MLSEVLPPSSQLSGRISDSAVASDLAGGRAVAQAEEFVPDSLDSSGPDRNASEQAGGAYEDQRIVHDDREILAEYEDDADGSRLRESSRKYVHSFWMNPVAYVKNSDGLGRTIAAYAVISAVISIALLFRMRYGEPQVSPHAGAVTDVAECSKIGMQIMKDGGSAVDAAIASMTCVGVINFHSTGTGGGGFMLVYDHRQGQGKVFDFRETAPAHFKPDMMPSQPVGDTPAKSDVLMVGVPGLLKGFDAAHRAYGRLPWHELFQPAIGLARDGFDVSAALAEASREKLRGRFLNEPLQRLLYSDNNVRESNLVSEGQRLRRQSLSDTLERIADLGAREFYEGHMATQLVEDVAAMGGILTLDDLRDYDAIIREPIAANVSDYVVMTSPPPASGPALIFGLKVMEQFTKSLEQVAPDYRLALDYNADAWQYLAETLKFMFIEQSRLGDVSSTVSTSDAVNRAQADMLSAATVERVFRSIDKSKVLDAGLYAKTVGIEQIISVNDAGTSGGVFVDNNELYVSVITSLGDAFGAGLLSEQLGILLNDHLRDFSSNSDDPAIDHTDNNNLARPNKRPLSSMTPTVFFHPTKSCFRRGAIAGSNGTRILSGMFEVLTRILLFDADLSVAIEAPRAHVVKFPDPEVFLESGVPQSSVDELVRRGQSIVALDERKQSTVNGLIHWNDTLVGHADSRKHGAGAMYL